MEPRAPAEHAEEASIGENRGTKGREQSEVLDERSTKGVGFEELCHRPSTV